MHSLAKTDADKESDGARIPLDLGAPLILGNQTDLVELVIGGIKSPGQKPTEIDSSPTLPQSPAQTDTASIADNQPALEASDPDTDASDDFIADNQCYGQSERAPKQPENEDSSEVYQRKRATELQNGVSGSSTHDDVTTNVDNYNDNNENNDNDDDDNDDYEEEEEEEEEDPMFEYSRIPKLPSTFFKKDLVSSVYVDESICVLATHSGLVHLAKADFTPIRTIRVHRASILDISCSGGYVATASIDGTVVIVNVSDAQDTVMASFKRPVHAVALHPDYANLKCYMSGGTAGQVLLSEKGWLKARSDSVIYQGNSTIVGLAWTEGGRALWCDDDGITIYDSNAQCILQRVLRLPNSPRSDLYAPRIHVLQRPASSNDGQIVLVGWASTIWCLSLREGKARNCINVAGIVGGVSPLHSVSQKEIVAVVLPRSSPANGSTGGAGAPELKVLSLEDGDEHYADEVTLSGYERLGPNDYHLEAASPSGPWYFVSASDAVVVRERTLHDHVYWLADHGRLFEAYEQSLKPETECSDEEQRVLALKAAESLTSATKLSARVLLKAAELLKRALPSTDAAQWSLWSQVFIETDELGAWGDVLPSDLDGLGEVRLKAINWASDHDETRLKQWLSAWPIQTYDAGAVVQLLAEKKQPLLLAHIHLALEEPLEAVTDYIAGNSLEAFDLVRDRHLWSSVDLTAVITSGLEPDSDLTAARVNDVVQARNEISPARVVDQLQGHDHILYEYLRQLTAIDEHQARDFADVYVRLLAEFGRPHLLSFLERHDNYDLSSALAICSERHYTRELVYLLGKVGQSARALDLIVEELDDLKAAVRFAQSHPEDPTLWDHLISHATTNPDLVVELLRCIEVSPVRVLSAIPKEMCIPGLKEILCSLMADEAANLRLAEGALEIVKAESQIHMRELFKRRKDGTLVPENTDADWNQPVIIMGDEVITVAEDNASSYDSAPHAFGRFTDKLRHLGEILTRGAMKQAAKISKLPTESDRSTSP